MSAPASAFEPPRAAHRDVPAFVRAASEVRLTLARSHDATSALRLYETGGLRVRFPKAATTCEGVLINTGGGIAGGDRVSVSCELQPGACATLTTQSAEKIYRAETAAAQVRVALTLAARSRLRWLPQETILFDGARLARTLDVAMTADASLTILETVVFGRLAHAERLGNGSFSDHWRIRRDGRLVFAEAIRLDGAIADTLDRPATGAGARALTTLLHLDPKAETRLAGLRRTLKQAKSVCGASAFNGLLIARFASADPPTLRGDVRRAASYIARADLPRVWAC